METRLQNPLIQGIRIIRARVRVFGKDLAHMGGKI